MTAKSDTGVSDWCRVDQAVLLVMTCSAMSVTAMPIGALVSLRTKQLSFERMGPKFENISSGTTKAVASRSVNGHRHSVTVVKFTLVYNS